MSHESIEYAMAELDRSLSQIERKQRQLAELSAQLRTHRSTAALDDGTVRATVDGNGRLCDLQISDEAMRQSHPQHLGRKLTRSVRRAQGEATSANSEDVAAALPVAADSSDEAPEDSYRLDEKRVRVPIDGGAGSVVSDALGRLRKVDIDARSVSYTSASRLAPKVLRAIQQADEKSRKLLADAIQEHNRSR